MSNLPIVERLPEHVEKLANTQMKISLEDWSFISSDILQAAATITELVSELEAIEAEMRFPNQLEAGFVHGRPTYKDMAQRVELAGSIARAVLTKLYGDAQ